MQRSCKKNNKERGEECKVDLCEYFFLTMECLLLFLFCSIFVVEKRGIGNDSENPVLVLVLVPGLVVFKSTGTGSATVVLIPSIAE